MVIRRVHPGSGSHSVPRFGKHGFILGVFLTSKRSAVFRKGYHLNRSIPACQPYLQAYTW